MKKILFSAVIFSFLLLLIGCQDHSMNNPVSSQPLNKTSLSNGKTVEGVIPLNYKLIDPFRSDIEYKLSGDIDYTEVPINPLPSETSAVNEDNLTESVIANLKIISSADIKNNTWKISDESDDVVKFSSDNADVLIKSYPIIGMANRMDLVCKFDVSQDGEELVSVFLSSPVVKNNTVQTGKPVAGNNNISNTNPF